MSDITSQYPLLGEITEYQWRIIYFKSDRNESGGKLLSGSMRDMH